MRLAKARESNSFRLGLPSHKSLRRSFNPLFSLPIPTISS